MSASQPDLPAVDQVAKQLPSKVFQPGALTYVVAIAVGGILTASGLAIAQAKLDASEGRVAARADAGAVVVTKALEQHIKDEAESRAAQLRFNERVMDAFQASEERSAKRFDALQNTILERRAQPESAELARPAPVKDAGR